MGVLDKLKDLLGIGPDSWDERLASTIELTSPLKSTFNAKWIGGPRGFDKKVGVFSFPGVDGNVVQDLGVNSTRYTIPLYFEGKNNDKESNRFLAICKEKGQWEIIHPVHGLFGLQLLSIIVNDEPVINGNITEVITEWIEPIDPATLKTARELAGIIDGGIVDLNTSALQDFANSIKEGLEEVQNTLQDVSDIVEGLSEKIFDPLNTILDSVDDTFNTLQDTIHNILNASVLEVQSLGGKFQNLIQTPLLASNDLQARLDIYDDAGDWYSDILPDVGFSDKALTQSAMGELAMLASLAGIGKITTTGFLKTGKVSIPAIGDSDIKSQIVEPQTLATKKANSIVTRVQAVQMAQKITGIFNKQIGKLENTQAHFSGQAIDKQYFTQTLSYANLLMLLSNINQFLMITSFDLKVEKAFTLKNDESVFSIVVREYGNLGINDENLDLFIQANDLKGSDIIMLPAGREVKVYI